MKVKKQTERKIWEIDYKREEIIVETFYLPDLGKLTLRSFFELVGDRIDGGYQVYALEEYKNTQIEEEIEWEIEGEEKKDLIDLIEELISREGLKSEIIDHSDFYNYRNYEIVYYSDNADYHILKRRIEFQFLIGRLKTQIDLILN